ncbi:MAG: DedA family protein [Magnetococcales bacterium]|nr:DedA family protein [Magnetococcales bacterium]
MDTLLKILEEYGYWVLFIGTFLEGETILLVAGYAASLGWLSLPLCILSAFGGTFSGDQLYFFLGRRFGRKLMPNRSRQWRRRITLVLYLLNKYDTWFILSFRFIYGVRNVTPFAVGMSRVPTYRFFLLNFLAAAVWAISFGTAGYWFGRSIEQFIGEAEHAQMYVLGIFVGIGVLIWAIQKWRGYRKDREEEEQEKKRPRAPSPL